MRVLPIEDDAPVRVLPIEDDAPVRHMLATTRAEEGIEVDGRRTRRTP